MSPVAAILSLHHTQGGKLCKKVKLFVVYIDAYHAIFIFKIIFGGILAFIIKCTVEMQTGITDIRVVAAT